ncbi:hypothetical protein NC651_039579 [Populus alba x Populus x berolinensis]|nr:hypothetical protein NC651_039579 [Populus alba x Populus x berolinensis]
MQVVPFSTPLLCKLALQNPKKKFQRDKANKHKDRQKPRSRNIHFL